MVIWCYEVRLAGGRITRRGCAPFDINYRRMPERVFVDNRDLEKERYIKICSSITLVVVVVVTAAGGTGTGCLE